MCFLSVFIIKFLQLPYTLFKTVYFLPFRVVFKIKIYIIFIANNANKSDVLNHSYSEFVVDFQKQCDFYIEKISEKLTVENLSDYLCFLERVEKGKEWLHYGNSK